MNRPVRALRKALSSSNHPATVALVDALLYFVLSFGTITVSSILHNQTHPQITYTPLYGSLALSLGSCAVGVALIGGFSTEYVQGEMKNRSVLRSILGTIAAIALTTGTTCALVKLFTSAAITTLDVTQYAGMFGLIVAPVGYRLFGFVKNPNVVTTTIAIGDGSQPALGVSDSGEMLAVWSPNSSKK